MEAVVIKEVAGTRAIITIIIKIYMKKNLISNEPAPPFLLVLLVHLLPLLHMRNEQQMLGARKGCYDFYYCI